MNTQTKELMDFWKEIKESSEIKFKDIEKLQGLLNKAISTIDDLVKSRDLWKSRALGKKEE